MSVLMLDGADVYATQTEGLRWGWAAWEWTEITAGQGRGSSSAFKAQGGNPHAEYVAPAPHGTLIVGFGLTVMAYPAATAQLVTIANGTDVVAALAMTTSGLLTVYTRHTGTGAVTLRGTSTYQYPLASMLYVEFKIVGGASGSLTGRVGEATQVSWSGNPGDDAGGGIATFNRVRLLGNSVLDPGGSVIRYVDDIIIMDGAGSTCNDFLGDRRLVVLRPSGAGNYTQFTPNTGANYAAVDDTTPDDDTTYVASGTDNQRDTYALGNLDTGIVIVDALVLGAYAKKTDAGARSLALTVRSGSTDSDGSDATLSTSYSYVKRILETDPIAAAAWSGSTVNALEIGVKARP